MNIVFLIGNGFDLNLGLKTRYRDFYEYYSSQRKNDQRKYVKEFLNEVNENVEEWSDFELSFGKYAQNFNKENSEEYSCLWSDIHLSLAEYINRQQKDALKPKRQTSLKMAKYLMYPDSFLARGARTKFNRLRGRTGNVVSRISVINFNYTDSFERLYGWEGKTITLPHSGTYSGVLDTVLHIHGTTYENMILGVDNPSQIHSQYGLDKNQKILNRVVKPIANRNTQTLRDQDCSAYISGANLICIFGMSLGATDKTWWRLIGERLRLSEAMSIIFTRGNDIPSTQKYLAVEQRNEKIDKLLEVAGIKDATQEVRSRIEVSFGSEMFGEFSDIVQPRDPVTGFKILNSVSN